MSTNVVTSTIDHRCPSSRTAEFVYHYHATYQTDAGAVANIDGIAQLSYEIKDIDGYRKLKSMIAPNLGPRLIITNISYLGRLSNTSTAAKVKEAT